jgi:hypothetical protein
MKSYSPHFDAIQNDLRKLIDAQEVFFADKVAYSASVDALSFHASPGVGVTLTTATSKAWTATFTHTALPKVRCSIAVGD